MATGKNFALFLAGLVIGGAAGILFAPRRGEKTRKKIAKRFRNISSGVVEKADMMTHQIKNGYEAARESFG